MSTNVSKEIGSCTGSIVRWDLEIDYNVHRKPKMCITVAVWPTNVSIIIHDIVSISVDKKTASSPVQRLQGLFLHVSWLNKMRWKRLIPEIWNPSLISLWSSIGCIVPNQHKCYPASYKTLWHVLGIQLLFILSVLWHCNVLIIPSCCISGYNTCAYDAKKNWYFGNVALGFIFVFL